MKKHGLPLLKSANNSGDEADSPNPLEGYLQQ